MPQSTLPGRTGRNAIVLALINTLSLSLLMSSEVFVGLASISWAMSIGPALTNFLYMISAAVAVISFVWLCRRFYRVEMDLLGEDPA